MKANEAPEKLWWSEGAVWHTNPNSIRYVEYTRTDAFVEKACEWLKENFSFDEAGYCKTNIYSTDSMIYNFKKYIRR